MATLKMNQNTCGRAVLVLAMVMVPVAATAREARPTPTKDTAQSQVRRFLGAFVKPARSRAEVRRILHTRLRLPAAAAVLEARPTPTSDAVQRQVRRVLGAFGKRELSRSDVRRIVKTLDTVRRSGMTMDQPQRRRLFDLVKNDLQAFFSGRRIQDPISEAWDRLGGYTPNARPMDEYSRELRRIVRSAKAAPEYGLMDSASAMTSLLRRASGELMDSKPRRQLATYVKKQFGNELSRRGYEQLNAVLNDLSGTWKLPWSVVAGRSVPFYTNPFSK
jgi:hypothetical protein